RVGAAAAALRAREAPRLALFAPAALGLGVWIAFAQAASPSPARLALIAAFGASAWLAAAALRRVAARLGASGLSEFLAAALRVFALAAALGALGYGAAEWRVASVAAPIAPEGLGARALSGRVLAVLPSRGEALRIRLDRLEIAGLAPERTPRRLDLTLRAPPPGRGPGALRLIDRRIAVTARVFPPPGPAEPGAFDFRFHAWFNGVGALAIEGEGPGEALRDLGASAAMGPADALRGAIARRRAEIAERAREAAPGVEGAVIAALLVGDRSGLPEPTLQALRDANLAHLLAISGLHMAMACMTMFALVRLLCAAPARAPFGVAPKKIAAVAALATGAVYLQLSGGGVPAERAFIMAAVAFGAVLADRPAVTLRGVAFAACVILLLRPESLLQAGFQLSFAATTAMVAAFEASRGIWRRERGAGIGMRAALWAGALVVSSAVAGLATAPFAALAFHRLTRYGLVANLLAVPFMGAWIMPLGMAALAAAPFGGDAPFYQMAALGVGAVLAIAETVASWPGAVYGAPAAPSLVPALITLGGLCLCLWRSLALKALAAAPLIAAAAIWSAAERPDLLIGRGGSLLAVRTDLDHAAAEGARRDGSEPSVRFFAADAARRAFDRDPRRRDYVASLWLRRDGEIPDLERATRRQAFARFSGGAAARLPGGWRVERVDARGRGAEALKRLCREKTLLIAPRHRLGAEFGPRRRAPTALTPDCLALSAEALRQGGAAAVWAPTAAGARPRIVFAAALAPRRPWTEPAR
ncbi:MAG: ComEC/Rec2 family competence protein, partial [Pseudomonadota bacterium]